MASGALGSRGWEFARGSTFNSPSATVCRVLDRIFSPIRPYKITIITMGNAKKTNVETSHSGNDLGLSSIAQNAESAISSWAVNLKKEDHCVLLRETLEYM